MTIWRKRSSALPFESYEILSVWLLPLLCSLQLKTSSFKNIYINISSYFYSVFPVVTFGG